MPFAIQSKKAWNWRCWDTSEWEQHINLAIANIKSEQPFLGWLGAFSLRHSKSLSWVCELMTESELMLTPQNRIQEFCFLPASIVSHLYTRERPREQWSLKRSLRVNYPCCALAKNTNLQETDWSWQMMTKRWKVVDQEIKSWLIRLMRNCLLDIFGTWF